MVYILARQLPGWAVGLEVYTDTRLLIAAWERRVAEGELGQVEAVVVWECREGAGKKMLGEWPASSSLRLRAECVTCGAEDGPYVPVDGDYAGHQCRDCFGEGWR